MSNQTQSSLLLVGAISGGIGFVAFLMLMVVGEYTFSPAAFLAIIIAGAVAVFLLLAFHGKTEAPKQAAPVAKPAPAAEPAPEPAPAAPAPEPVAAAPAPEPEPAPEPAVEGGSKPAALEGARDGKADDLKMIKGVGPKLEKLLNSMGFYHFDQVAAWTSNEVAWVDENLEGFKGRVSRDNWVAQAKTLASGGETEFSKKVEDGDVY